MNTKVILNACTPDYREQCEMLAGLLQASTGLSSAMAWILCPPEYKEKSVVALAPTEHVVLLEWNEASMEETLSALEPWMKDSEVLLFPGNYWGLELAGRLACRLNGGAQNAVKRLTVAEDHVCITKSVYGGHMEGTFRMKRAPYCMTADRGLEGDCVVSARVDAYHTCEIQAQSVVRIVGFEEEPPAAGLRNAERILAVGRAVKKPEEMEKVQQAADAIGAEVGCSRPVVMTALAPMDRLIGVSGAMTKPDLCIAAGVSGAPAFYAGVEKSKLLISVNQSPDAPIHKKSDYVILGDMREFVEEIRAYIDKTQRT